MHQWRQRHLPAVLGASVAAAVASAVICMPVAAASVGVMVDDFAT